MVAIAGSMGFEVLVFIFIGAVAGKYAGSHWGNASLWLPLGAAAGFLFGMFSCFMTLRSFIKK